MRLTRGQALVELALCAPLVILLGLGGAVIVQVEDAGAGLDAATHAAAGAAARAPDPASADVAAHARFEAVAAGYPLRGATLGISFGSFSRSIEMVATSTAFVDVGWSGLILPRRLVLHSRAVMRLEPWRTHRSAA